LLFREEGSDERSTPQIKWRRARVCFVLLLPEHLAGQSAVAHFCEHVNRPPQLLRTGGEAARAALLARVSQAVPLTDNWASKQAAAERMMLCGFSHAEINTSPPTLAGMLLIAKFDFGLRELSRG
jgi:hypothetical protein